MMEENKQKIRRPKQILKSQMSKKEFTERLKKLDCKKSLFARFSGINEQTVRGWGDGKIPLYAERLLVLLEITKQTNQAKDIFEKIYQNNIVYENSKIQKLIKQ